MPEHLFQCTSPTRMALQQKLREQLSTFCTQSGFDPHWYQLWWMGLTHPNKPEVHTINLYPPHLHSIHQSQQTIGWKHLYYGRLSKQWTQFLATYHPDLDPSRTLAKILGIVWTHMLQIWTSRNEDDKSATIQFPPNMLSDLNGIYAARD